MEERAKLLRPEAARSLPNHSEETDDDAIVDLENALDVASLERSALELREIEQALVRLRTAEIGECRDCGAEIPYARLLANLLATRCTKCQTGFERSHAAAGHSSL